MATSEQNPYEAPSKASPQILMRGNPFDGKRPLVIAVVCWPIMAATVFGIAVGLLRVLLWIIKYMTDGF